MNVKKSKKFTAECHNCGWFGSKYRLLMSMFGQLCPKCESPNTSAYENARTKGVLTESKKQVH